MDQTRYNVQSPLRDLVIVPGQLVIAADASLTRVVSAGGVYTAAKAATGRYRITFRQKIPAVALYSAPMPIGTLQSLNQATLAGAFNVMFGQLDLTTTPKTPTLDIFTTSAAGALADVSVACLLNFALFFSNSSAP
jgi:hypothetical protein